MPRCAAILLAMALANAAACGEPEFPVGIPCSEADTCPPGQVCDPFDRRCRPMPIETECRQDSDCASGVCDEGTGRCVDGCRPETCVAGSCEVARCEGDMCVVESLCGDSETCCGGACVAAGCDDGNPCTEDSCGAEGCEHLPASGASCDDGVHCNGTDACVDGACQAHAGDPCASPTLCDEGQDTCVGCVEDADCPAAEVGEPSECGGFADLCDASGTSSRTVTTYTCQDSVCVSRTVTEDEACQRITEGVACGPAMYSPWGGCAGFDGTCDASGMQSREVTTYACVSEVCTSATATEQQACHRNTDGVTCGEPVVGAWGACSGFDDTCDEGGTRSRDVTAFACVSEACTPSTSQESGSCARDTDDVTCAPTEHGSWSACGGFSGTCDETGTRTRSVTTHACSGGGCASMIGTETGSCERDTDGTACGTVTCGVWSACSGFSGTCDETGTRTRQCTSPVCSGGTCSVTLYAETESCNRNTDDEPCGSTSCGAWSTCAGFSGTCDETGTQNRTCTTSTCSNGACTGSITETETRGCNRNTDGVTCGDMTCGSWGACNLGGEECGWGTQARTCETDACDSGTCNGTATSIETQACFRGCSVYENCISGRCCPVFGGCPIPD